jgi:hypothetical protein
MTAMKNDRGVAPAFVLMWLPPIPSLREGNPEVSVAPIGFERSLKHPPRNGISEANPKKERECEAPAFVF